MLRVKEICKEKGITVANLAHRLGVQPPALSRIINGGTTTTATLERIAKALDVSIADLFEKPEEIRLFAEYKGDRHEITKRDIIRIIEER